MAYTEMTDHAINAERPMAIGTHTGAVVPNDVMKSVQAISIARAMIS